MNKKLAVITPMTLFKLISSSGLISMKIRFGSVKMKNEIFNAIETNAKLASLFLNFELLKHAILDFILDIFCRAEL
jgi:hypothetical protein